MAGPGVSAPHAFVQFDEAFSLLEQTFDLPSLEATLEDIARRPLFLGLGYARWSHPPVAREPDYLVLAGAVRAESLTIAAGADPWDAPFPDVRFEPSGQLGPSTLVLVPVLGPRRRYGLFCVALAIDEPEWVARRYDWRGRALLLGCVVQHRVNLWTLDDRPTLGRREIQCLALAAEGFKAKQIAGALGIGQQTVQFHLSRAREKLACGNTVQAVARAAQFGLLSDLAAPIDWASHRTGGALISERREGKKEDDATRP